MVKQIEGSSVAFYFGTDWIELRDVSRKVLGSNNFLDTCALIKLVTFVIQIYFVGWGIFRVTNIRLSSRLSAGV
jgi:hypothetical protein